MAEILSGRARGLRLATLLLVVLYATGVLPLLLGSESLVLRDTLATHRPLKAFGAQALARGEVPVLNVSWALGQPFAGNPNALPFYPGNLAYLALPFEAAFHLHFVLHGLIAFFTMRKLALATGADPPGAVLAGATYAGSGFVLSTWSFYNILVVAAWAPLVLWGIRVGTRRGLALGGLACGLALLGGEPVTALLLVPLMAAVALSTWGLRGGLGRALAVGALGLAVAAPQLVATARVLAWSQRALEGIDPLVAGAQNLHPARLLELLLPLPWGSPSDFSRFGFWSKRVTPFTPYIFSLHVGVVGAALALAGALRARLWAGIAGVGLFLAWFGGVAPGLLAALSGGVFRYPQKLIFWFTLGAALAAGHGLRVLLASPRAARALAALGLAMLGTALALRLALPSFIALLTEHFVRGGPEGAAATPAGTWIVGLAVGGALAVLAGWGARRGVVAAVVAAQAFSLAQLLPIVATDEAALYRDPPPFFSALEGRRSVVGVSWILPEWEPGIPYPAEVNNPAGMARLTFLDLEPWVGVGLGLTYPLAPNLEGIYSPLHAQLARALARSSWPERVRWLRRLGAEAMVRAGPPLELADLALLATDTRWGVATSLYALERPAPLVAWPRAVVAEPDLGEVYRRIASGALGDDESVVAQPLAHDPSGRIRALESSADRLIFEAESAGGLAVLRRDYQPFLIARLDDGTALPTLPADLTLLGVVVPPGRHRVTVAVSSAPERAALLFALAAAAAALAFAWRRAPA